MSTFDNDNNVVISSRTRNGRAIIKSDSESVGGLNRFRSLGRKKRALLAKGDVLELINDSQAQVATMPLDLFYALSNKTDVVSQVDGAHRIELPAYTSEVAVKELVTRLSTFTNPSVDVSLMESTGSIVKDIHLASVAEFLGVTAYTQRMFTAHWHHFGKDLVFPTDITELCNVKTPLADKVVERAAYNVAKRYCNDTLPNDEAFKQYLTINTRFEDAVNVLLSKWKDAEDAAEESHKAYLVREERRQAKAKREQGRKQRDAKKAAEAKAYAAAGESVREKMRHAGAKYTALEAKYMYNTFGKRVPVAAGKK